MNNRQWFRSFTRFQDLCLYGTFHVSCHSLSVNLKGKGTKLFYDSSTLPRNNEWPPAIAEAVIEVFDEPNDRSGAFRRYLLLDLHGDLNGDLWAKDRHVFIMTDEIVVKCRHLTEVKIYRVVRLNSELSHCSYQPRACVQRYRLLVCERENAWNESTHEAHWLERLFILSVSHGFHMRGDMDQWYARRICTSKLGPKRRHICYEKSTLNPWAERKYLSEDKISMLDISCGSWSRMEWSISCGLCC